MLIPYKQFQKVFYLKKEGWVPCLNSVGAKFCQIFRNQPLKCDCLQQEHI